MRSGITNERNKKCSHCSVIIRSANVVLPEPDWIIFNARLKVSRKVRFLQLQARTQWSKSSQRVVTACSCWRKKRCACTCSCVEMWRPSVSFSLKCKAALKALGPLNFVTNCFHREKSGCTDFGCLGGARFPLPAGGKYTAVLSWESGKV